MHLLIVNEKEETKLIKELFTANNYFDISTQANLHLLSQKNTDVLVVFEKAVSINTLIERQIYLPDLKYQFFVLNNENEEKRDLCIANGIIPITFRTDQDIVTIVTETIYPENPKSKRLFLFMGADHKAGTTTIIHSLAEQLAYHIQKKVLVVSLANKPNDEFADFSKSSIDNLRTLITSKVIVFSEIFRESDQVKNYRFMAGPRDIVQYRRYTVEEIVNYIEVLRDQEDYLVLIDGGSDIDNPLVMAALQRVQHKFIVMANWKSHYKSLDQKIKQVLNPAFGLTYSSFLYLFNHYDEDVETTQKIQERGGICAGSIPHSKNGNSAEEQGINLANIDEEIKSKIFNITKLIAIKADCPIHTEPVKQSLFKRFFTSKKGGELSGVSS